MDQKLFEKRVIIIVGLIILFGFGFILFNSEIFNPPHPRMTIIKINESRIPEGEIIRIIDNDFKDYPYLAPIIRDNSQNGLSYHNGTRINFNVGLSWTEKDKILGSKFFLNRNAIFEYNGSYYYFEPPEIP